MRRPLMFVSAAVLSCALALMSCSSGEIDVAPLEIGQSTVSAAATSTTRPSDPAAVVTTLPVRPTSSSSPPSSSTSSTSTSTTTTVASTTTTTVAVPQPTVAPITFRPLDYAGIATYGALASGEVQLALVYTTQATLSDGDLVVLEDDRRMQPAQHLVPFGRSEIFIPEVRAVLDSVSRRLSTDDLVLLNHQVERQGLPLDQVVDAWVTDNQLVAPTQVLTGDVIVGAPLFIEQQIVASIYGRALSAAGANVTYRLDLPSREVVAAEIEAGRVHLTAEYAGALLTYLGGIPTGNVYAVHKELAFRAAARGLSVATPASATDTDALAVRRDVAERLGLTKVSDLARVTEPLVMGGPPECPQLPTCIKGFTEVYGIDFVL